MLSLSLSLLGVVIALASASTYFKLIIAGHIKPHRITWAGWSLAGILGFWASLAGGAKVGILVTGAFTFLVVLTFLLSLSPKYGKPGGSRSDYIAGALAAAAILSWRLFNFSPAVAATIAVLADAVFLWFTLKEAWIHPEEEDPRPWIMGSVAELLGVITLGNYSYASAAFPVYILFGNLAIAWALVIRDKQGLPKRRRAN